VQVGHLVVGSEYGYWHMLADFEDYRHGVNSVVHRLEFGRLQKLMALLKVQGVANGVGGLGRYQLDPWQAFAHDILVRRDRETSSSPVRCFVIGSAGTGKSRTVRSIVSVRRAIVKRRMEGRYNLSKGIINDAVRHCCQLGSPTASSCFQLKFGASTLHRLFGLPIGYCGPSDRHTLNFRKKNAMIRLCKLYVLDDLSMIGRRMLGKIEFKLREHLESAPVMDGTGPNDPVMGQKDYVLCGDPKSLCPIGDEPIYREGEYTGRSENKPLWSLTVPAGAMSAKALVRMGDHIRDCCNDVVILHNVHRYQDFDPSLSVEKWLLYADEAVKFLEVTRGMADCTWTPAQHAWLSLRNVSSLQQTSEGSAQLQKFRYAPLLMYDKIDLVSGQSAVSRFNNARLRALSVRIGKPIVDLCADHDTLAVPYELMLHRLPAVQFSGLENSLSMCEEARVMLTDDILTKAGLRNGAIGTLKGFMWPEGGHPLSLDPTKRTPLCVIVEFDNVNLKDENDSIRTFFPGDDSKARWVPVFRKCVESSLHEGVYRLQYPLVLAWALGYRQVQGMTLDAVRLQMCEKTVRFPGSSLLALTRVRHPWHLVFEDDLPGYSHFMKVRDTSGFRMRRRWELRLQERASNTLRKYRYCTHDVWTQEEADAAQCLIDVLMRTAAERRESLRTRIRGVVDADTWLWGTREPCYEALLDAAVSQLQPLDTDLYQFVSQRLLDRIRRRFLSPAEQFDAAVLLKESGQSGRACDSQELIAGLAAFGSDEFHRYVAVASLIRRRLLQVSTWDNMIDEALPAHIGCHKGILSRLGLCWSIL